MSDQRTTSPDTDSEATKSLTLPRAGSDDAFRLLVEGVKEYAIFLLSPDGYVMTWNEGAESIKGYTEEEIIGQHFSRFYLPEAIRSGRPARALELAAESGQFADEGWRIKKDGSRFWASVSINAIRDCDGTLLGFTKVTRDLTERRNSEEHVHDLNRHLRIRVEELATSEQALQLRTAELQRLSAQLLRAQDAERRRIARELHDDLGQQLSLLSMTLNAILPDNPEYAKIRDAMQVTDQALKSVRSLSYLLHPPLLDEVGLAGALRRCVEGFSNRGGMKVSLVLEPANLPRMAKDVEMAIFRIVQECLTNAHRHANTESARVEIQIQNETAIVLVRDYGKGIRKELLENHREFANGFGVGLAGMRERVCLLNGELILSNEEPGMKVEARIPLSRTMA